MTGQFSPWASVTRAWARLTGPFENGVLGPFDPIHGPNVYLAEGNGLLEGLVGFGYGFGWNPWAKATRGEVSQVLWSLMELQ